MNRGHFGHFRLWRVLGCIVCVLGFGAGAALHAQGTLSQQVLQLLTRTNTWIGTNTFNDLRVANTAIPSTTTYRIYADPSGNLYFNGGLIAGAGGGVTPHNLLSTTHADTVAAGPTRGDVIVANSTPAWARLAKCTAGYFLGATATDTACSNDATSFVNIPGAAITGTIAAVSGVNLTSLNATQLTSGTVPLARLVGITNTEIAAGAAIVRSKLSLAAGIVLTTDVTGVLPFANGGTNLSAAADDTVLVSSGAAWVAKAMPNCTGTTSALGYTTATNTFSCLAVSVGTGTATSVALSLPAIFTVSGSPVTVSGTLTGTLASQSQNLVWASPNGSSGAPTFRAIVSADYPTSGAVAGTYPLVTVNNKGIVTAGSASLAAGTITTSTPWTFTQTWNAGGVTFNGILENITDTASTAGSTLLDLQVAAASKWAVTKAGVVTQAGGLTITGALAGATTGSFSGAVSMTALTATTGGFSSTVSMTALTATTGTFSGLIAANAGITTAAGQTATVTDTDKLLVGGNKIPNTQTFTCYGMNVNSLSGDCMFIADRAYQVTAIKVEQKTQGGAGCVADVEKLTGTTAPGSGTVMGTGSYDCNATVNNTVTTYTLTGTVSTLQLAAGDRMGIKLGGTLTALAGLTATIQLKAI